MCFRFLVNGIKAEATTNTEMILITDIDLNQFGSVRNLKDRRTGIYEVNKLFKK